MLYVASTENLNFGYADQAVMNMINHPLFYIILRHTELMQYANYYNNNREIQAVWIAKPRINISLLLLLLLHWDVYKKFYDDQRTTIPTKILRRFVREILAVEMFLLCIIMFFRKFIITMMKTNRLIGINFISYPTVMYIISTMNSIAFSNISKCLLVEY